MQGRITQAVNEVLRIIFISFKEVPERPETLYNDKQICVTGMIKEYKGKLQIDVEIPKEIVVE